MRSVFSSAFCPLLEKGGYTTEGARPDSGIRGAERISFPPFRESVLHSYIFFLVFFIVFSPPNIEQEPDLRL